MPAVSVSLSIVYETQGPTPVADLVAALRATEALVHDAVSLLPSLVDGLAVDAAGLSVRTLRQESPLREVFAIALIAAFQDKLVTEVPPLLEDLTGLTISDRYDSLVTVTFLVVLFYGASLAKDLASKVAENTRTRRMLNDLVEELTRSTGKSETEVRAILEARFAKPKATRRLVEAATGWFKPSHREGAAPVIVDRYSIPADVVRDVPPRDAFDKPSDFDRYTPISAVRLELHAMDKDRGGSGWAAVAEGVSDRRLKMRVMEPVSPSDLWGRDEVVGDIVVVSRLTAQGYVPAEIHLSAIVR